MAEYVEPKRWNDETKRLAEEDEKSENKLKKYKFAEDFYSLRKDSDPEKQAAKQLANMAEQDIEDNRQRILDQYPKGTKNSYGQTSSNESEYGEKPKLKYKSGGKVSKPKVSSASKRADGCCVKGKTRGQLR